jgi:protein gp37
MFRDMARFGKDPEKVTRTADKTFYGPDRLPKEPCMVFTCSWSDWFHPDADQWRPEAWQTIKRNPHITFQILTKRPGRIARNLPPDWGDGYENVWLGVSAGTQKTAKAFIPLLQARAAAVRFISIEPLLEPIEFQANWLNGIHWIIIGGESGTETGEFAYRPCQLDWITEIIVQAGNIPIFIKQLGGHLAKKLNLKDRSGGAMEEWPNGFKIREFPETQKTPTLFF